MWYDKLLEKGLIPEFLLRLIIRLHLEYRLSQQPDTVEEIQKHLNMFIEKMEKNPITIEIKKANEQHYEIPTRFFQQILGGRLKYSCGYWDNIPSYKDLPSNLDKSEEDMLFITCKRAQIEDGQRILELGCGWGSLLFFILENYEVSEYVAITNSKSQKQYIETLAEKRNINNLRVIKSDVSQINTEGEFDRIVSIEMFEHVRNYRKLLAKLSQILKKEGKLFIHIFTDKNYPYFYELDSTSGWMAKYFFRGGIMPSANLLFYFSDNFSVEKVWRVNGLNYKLTLDAWLRKMKNNKKTVFPILEDTYGKKNAKKWWHYWNTFFISCSEAFGIHNGNQRFVSHYLLNKG
jgi:cyclopropane-fatty-acyl-phospholipid synthase